MGPNDHHAGAGTAEVVSGLVEEFLDMLGDGEAGDSEIKQYHLSFQMDYMPCMFRLKLP